MGAPEGEAIQRLELARRLAEQTGDPHCVAFSRASDGMASFCRGEWSRCEGSLNNNSSIEGVRLSFQARNEERA